ncbi:hypothetical protein [Candidatus Mesenet endosymbiont of Agriotes lineatus]|uniref:hypothetical protein n=1 Tax=Candidatus Mesenet endosymbiont of Agriotes lineatus TaxID=3077948 RepID=UPI0030CA67A9
MVDIKNQNKEHKESPEDILESSKEYQYILESEKFLEDEYEIINEKDYEKLPDDMQKEDKSLILSNQESKDLTYHIINKSTLCLEYSIKATSYLLSGVSHATYFASYVPYSVSYLLTREENRRDDAIDKSIFGFKSIMDSVTQILVGTSSVLNSASYIPYNISSALNKENRDYIAVKGSAYVSKGVSYLSSSTSYINDFVANSLKDCKIQSILPTIPMVI